MDPIPVASTPIGSVRLARPARLSPRKPDAADSPSRQTVASSRVLNGERIRAAQNAGTAVHGSIHPSSPIAVEDRSPRPVLAGASNSPGLSGSAPSVLDAPPGELEAYLQMIRQLSRNPEAVDRFVRQLNAFAEGTGSGAALRSVSSNAAGVEAAAREAASSSNGAASVSETATVSETGGVKGTRVVEIPLPANEGEAARVIRMQFRGETLISASVEDMQQSDPLTLDLDGDGLELTSVGYGAMFDIDAEGVRRATAFATGGDAFLALDRNANGRIDDGTELFGDQNGAAGGFEELRKHDDNRDGRIDAADPVFKNLMLFSASGLRPGEAPDILRPLSSESIAAILLDSEVRNERVSGGNLVARSGTFVRNDGSTGEVADVKVNVLG